MGIPFSLGICFFAVYAIKSLPLSSAEWNRSKASSDLYFHVAVKDGRYILFKFLKIGIGFFVASLFPWEQNYLEVRIIPARKDISNENPAVGGIEKFSKPSACGIIVRFRIKIIVEFIFEKIFNLLHISKCCVCPAEKGRVFHAHVFEKAVRC